MSPNEFLGVLADAIVNGKVLAAPAFGDNTPVSVGRETVGDNVRYPVIFHGEAKQFGSPAGAVAHFIERVGWLAIVDEVDSPVGAGPRNWLK